MTKTSKKDVILEKVLFIYYLMQFRKNQVKTQALIDSGSEINVITLAYIASLGLKVWQTNVGAQKINGSTLEIFEIALTSF